MRFLFFFYFTWMLSNSFGQSLISSAGGHGVSGNGTLGWSLGEMIIETAAGSNSVLTQGFQQPADSTLAINSLELSDFQVYPNPFSDILHIQLWSEHDGVNLLLFDLSGKILLQRTLEKIGETTFSINLSHLSAGSYVIQIIEHESAYSRNSLILKQ